MLKALGRAIGDSVMMAAVGTVTAGIGVLVAFNIATTIVPPKDGLWAEFRCVTGMAFKGDEACFESKLKDGLQKMEFEFGKQRQLMEESHKKREEELDATIRKRGEEIAALEQRGRDLESEKAGVLKTRGDLEEQLKKLEAIEKSSTSFTLFTQKPWVRGLVVTTGVEYKSFVQSQEWTKSWCYVHFNSSSGVLSKLDLGDKRAGGAVIWADESAPTMTAGGFTSADVEEARKLCAFPEAGA